MIELRLKEIARGLGGRCAEPREVRTSRGVRDRLQLLACLAIGAIERGHGFRDPGRHRRELTQILLAEIGVAKQRVRQHLAEPAHEARLVVLGEALQVDAEILPELQQQG